MPKVEDIALDAYEAEEIREWESNGAHEHAARMALEYRKRRYMGLFLEGSTVRSERRNCYSEGVVRYVRKDGAPITEDDIRAIDMCRYGQGHAIRGRAGDMEVFHHWHCDSSD